MKTILLGIVVLSSICVSQTAAQPSTIKSPRDVATGQASGLVCGLRGDVASKAACLSDSNITKSVNSSFSQTITDSLGKARQVNVSKVDRLKSPGYRYHVTIDGQRREISYLIVKSGEVAIINVDGTRPLHNFYMPFYGKDRATLTAEFWSGERLLTEAFAPNGKQSFSIWESDVDEHSFALYTMALNQIAELSPSTLFPGSGSDNAADSFSPNGLFGKGIGARLGCRFRLGTKKRCGTGCTPTRTEEDQGWNLFGSKRRRECAASGCMMCAGICCKSDTCSSSQDNSIDCSAGLTGGTSAVSELFFNNGFEAGSVFGELK